MTCKDCWGTVSLGTVSSDLALVQHESSWILRDPNHRTQEYPDNPVNTYPKEVNIVTSRISLTLGKRSTRMHFLCKFKTISLSPLQVILQSSESILIVLTGNLEMHSLFTLLPVPSMKHAVLYTQMYHYNSSKCS